MPGAARAHAAPGPAGLRPVPEGQPPVQPARCPRRDQRHRARGLHRPGARAGAGVLQGLAAGARASRRRGGLAAMAELLLELLSEEIPARMQERAAADLGELVGRGADRGRSSRFEQISALSPRRAGSRCVVHGLPAQAARRAWSSGADRASARRSRRSTASSASLGVSDYVLEERDDRKGRVLRRPLPARRPADARGAGRRCSARSCALPLAQVDALGRATRSAGCGRCTASSACSTARSCRSSSGRCAPAPPPAATASSRPAPIAVRDFDDYRQKLRGCLRRARRRRAAAR